MTGLRIALAQINPTVGDIAGNTARIAAGMEAARAGGVDLVAFPELAVTGYPPEDLLLKTSFIERNLKAVEELAPASRGITAIIGFVDRGGEPAGLYNAAAVLHDGRRAATYHKHLLPNYGVFDEKRYFRPGEGVVLLQLGEVPVGVSICEDAWWPEGPCAALGRAGARLIVNINASPFETGKIRARETVLAARAAESGAVVAYVNTVGGQDELVFDGRSMVVAPDGRVIARGKAFAEDILFCDLHLGREVAPLPAREAPPAMDTVEEAYQALMLGTRDYVRKNGFKKVVLGISGGIDSSLVACIAVDALGAESVTGLFMPSRYTSPESREDAAALAANLGIPLIEIPIDGLFQHYLDELAPHMAGRPADTTEENIQARIRGNLLMAFSNKFGWLVLSTGDKSETSVGYMTLYGDMAGGFAVIKDVPKTMAYALARHRNQAAPVIPARVLVKPPSPELKAGQKATDTLPPYEVLDPILKAYVEEDRSPAEIAAMGFPEDTVRRVIRMVDGAEYKRRQAPPGVKISPRAFGRDRRMPITNRFKG